jgi:metallo-beta-lactamase class B
VKIIITTIILLKTLFFLGCQSRQAAPPIEAIVPEAPKASRVEVKQFLPTAYVVFHHLGQRVMNSLLVEMKNGELVLVDTPMGESATMALLGWLQYKFGGRKIVAINTAACWDRISGNGTLIENGARVLAFAKTRSLILNQKLCGTSPATSGFPQDLRASPPTEAIGVNNEKVLDFDGQKVLLFHPGRGYTADNIVVFFESERILFAGGLVSTSPATRSPKEAAAWVSSLKKLSRFDTRWVVPAAGRRLAPDLIKNTVLILQGSAGANNNG